MASQSLPRSRPVALATVLTVGLHGLLLGGVLLANLFIIPRYEQSFRKMQVELPAITAASISTFRWLRAHWYLAPPAWAVLLAADALVYIGLSRAFTSRLPRFLYSMGVMLIIAFFVSLTILAMYAPLIRLMMKVGD